MTLFSFRFLGAALLATAPVLALAGTNPDFQRDARPILERQPGLVQYIHSHFVVKETGIARVPGTPDRPPQPPFIFSARARSASGPFNLRLLIQPGPEGHILKVADIRQLPQASPPAAPAAQPEQISQAPIPNQTIGSAAPAAGASSSSSTSPSSDTPSGPIRE